MPRGHRGGAPATVERRRGRAHARLWRLIRIKESGGKNSYRRGWRQGLWQQSQGGERSDQMAEKDDVPAGGSLPERIPFMQRLLDNPFLLLFLGVTIPTVFYILWGVMELTQVPVAR
jgi:hypothetical protein